MTSADDDLALAHELADLADAISLARFRAEDLIVETKPDLTPVTEADKAVERAIRDRLAQVRPNEPVVGEEFGADADKAPARWIVDPIDGTKSYVRGIPVYATLIALERDGVVQTGLASAPALGRRRWWASRGQGAFADGRRIHVSKVARLEDAQLVYSGLGGWRRAGLLDAFIAMANRCWRTRGYGDFWMHLLVAEGSADLAAELEVSIWDLAAVQVIVEEAGGRFTDLSGTSRPDGGSAVSTNGQLHDEVLAHLSAPPDSLR